MVMLKMTKSDWIFSEHDNLPKFWVGNANIFIITYLPYTYYHENPLKSTLSGACYFEMWRFDYLFTNVEISYLTLVPPRGVVTTPLTDFSCRPKIQTNAV